MVPPSSMPTNNARQHFPASQRADCRANECSFFFAVYASQWRAERCAIYDSQWCAKRCAIKRSNLDANDAPKQHPEHYAVAVSYTHLTLPTKAKV